MPLPSQCERAFNRTAHGCYRISSDRTKHCAKSKTAVYLDLLLHSSNQNNWCENILPEVSVNVRRFVEGLLLGTDPKTF